MLKFQATSRSQLVTNKPLSLQVSGVHHGQPICFHVPIKISKEKIKRKTNLCQDLRCVFMDSANCGEIVASQLQLCSRDFVTLVPDSESPNPGFLMQVETKGGKTDGRKKQNYLLLQHDHVYNLRLSSADISITDVSLYSVRGDVQQLKFWTDSFSSPSSLVSPDSSDSFPLFEGKEALDEFMLSDFQLPVFPHPSPSSLLLPPSQPITAPQQQQQQLPAAPLSSSSPNSCFANSSENSNWQLTPKKWNVFKKPAPFRCTVLTFEDVSAQSIQVEFGGDLLPNDKVDVYDNTIIVEIPEWKDSLPFEASSAIEVDVNIFADGVLKLRCVFTYEFNALPSANQRVSFDDPRSDDESYKKRKDSDDDDSTRSSPKRHKSGPVRLFTSFDSLSAFKGFFSCPELHLGLQNIVQQFMTGAFKCSATSIQRAATSRIFPSVASQQAALSPDEFLKQAMQAGRLDVFVEQVLIDAAAARIREGEVNYLDEQGFGMLHYAAATGSMSLVKQLIQHASDIKLDVNLFGGATGYTALDLAKQKLVMDGAELDCFKMFGTPAQAGGNADGQQPRQGHAELARRYSDTQSIIQMLTHCNGIERIRIPHHSMTILRTLQSRLDQFMQQPTQQDQSSVVYRSLEPQSTQQFQQGQSFSQQCQAQLYQPQRYQSRQQQQFGQYQSRQQRQQQASLLQQCFSEQHDQYIPLQPISTQRILQNIQQVSSYFAFSSHFLTLPLQCAARLRTDPAFAQQINQRLQFVIENAQVKYIMSQLASMSSFSTDPNERSLLSQLQQLWSRYYSDAHSPTTSHRARKPKAVVPVNSVSESKLRIPTPIRLAAVVSPVASETKQKQEQVSTVRVDSAVSTRSKPDFFFNIISPSIGSLGGDCHFMAADSAISRFAISVGINNYATHGLPNLRGAVNDAVAFTNTLVWTQSGLPEVSEEYMMCGVLTKAAPAASRAHTAALPVTCVMQPTIVIS